MKKVMYLMILLSSFIVHSYSIDSEISGTDIKYKNIINSGSHRVLAPWKPVSNLLPSINWSPGFKYEKKNIKLNGPGGVVDISDAIKIIGIEYKSNNSLNIIKNTTMTGTRCNEYGYSGDISYVISNVLGTCRSDDIYDSYSKMPFHFIRPIVSIDENYIIAAFDSLSNKKEGYYSGNIPINYLYMYEQINGIKTWRNLKENIYVNFYYKASFITSVRLQDPTEHLMDIVELSSNKIRGSTIFNIIAEGYFNNGLNLTLDSSNKYYLFDSKSGHNLNISIKCSTCDNPELVKDGKIINSKTSITGIDDSKITFPIDVNFEEEKSLIPIGTYKGQFTMIFSVDI
ncbi:hypothetical protein ACPV3P_00900 [Photobacterium damselae]|uniref:hypothetical protein n=1 Tax=Photobacterium damselae TaxID=38293 RepID=UPI00406865BE